MLAKICLDHGKHNIVMVEGIILCNALSCVPYYEKCGCVSTILLIMMAAVIWAFTHTGIRHRRSENSPFTMQNSPANIQ